MMWSQISRVEVMDDLDENVSINSSSFKSLLESTLAHYGSMSFLAF